MNITQYLTERTQVNPPNSYATLAAALLNVITSILLMVLMLLLKTTNLAGLLKKKKPAEINEQQLQDVINLTIKPSFDNIVNFQIDLMDSVRRLTPVNSLSESPVVDLSSNGSNRSGSN